jgi:hypothetical protein
MVHPKLSTRRAIRRHRNRRYAPPKRLARTGAKQTEKGQERIDSFPNSQRFIIGQRLAGHAIDVLELLGQATYTSNKLDLLERVHRQAAFAGARLLTGCFCRSASIERPLQRPFPPQAGL